MLPSEPLEKIQSLLNTVIRQDERALASVSGLSGKTVLIQALGTDLSIFVKFQADGVLLLYEHNAKPHVTIRARPLILAGLLFNRDGKAPGITPDMEISGDTHLAQSFQQIFRELQIDWEEHLSHWVGDIPAHQAGRLFKATLSYLRQTRAALGMNISEYLRYEKEILPVREDIRAFVSAVDVLRDDAERLQQRFDRLQRKLT